MAIKAAVEGSTFTLNHEAVIGLGRDAKAKVELEGDPLHGETVTVVGGAEDAGDVLVRLHGGHNRQRLELIPRFALLPLRGADR